MTGVSTTSCTTIRLVRSVLSSTVVVVRAGTCGSGLSSCGLVTFGMRGKGGPEGSDDGLSSCARSVSRFICTAACVSSSRRVRSRPAYFSRGTGSRSRWYSASKSAVASADGDYDAETGLCTRRDGAAERSLGPDAAQLAPVPLRQAFFEVLLLPYRAPVHAHLHRPAQNQKQITGSTRTCTTYSPASSSSSRFTLRPQKLLCRLAPSGSGSSFLKSTNSSDHCE